MQQYWIDKRLAFKNSNNKFNEAILAKEYMRRIWLPDTVLGNLSIRKS
jgi:hypothetical protein